jgi:hypothetical protein
MPLYYLSIAYNGETWYEKYFHAVQEDTTKQNAYRVRVNKMLNNKTEKPSEYIDFLKITKVPMNIRVELENFYTNSKTYSEFFHLIPKQDRCRLLRPWIKEFMNYYLKGVFSNFDWEIQLSNIRGGSLSKTRKKQNKSEKKYYCPNGFNRNMNYLKDIGFTPSVKENETNSFSFTDKSPTERNSGDAKRPNFLSVRCNVL